MDIRGKVCVITGASRGIGAGLAEALAQRGAKLALCARSRCELPAGAEGITEQLDVAEARAVMGFATQARDTLGEIELWVNNAGVLAPIAPLRDISASAFAEHLGVNLMGVVHGSQAFLTQVRSRAGRPPGVLVNVSSGAAWQGYAGWAPYCASKAAVERVSECLQLEEAPHLRVHAVAPGIVDTDMQSLIRSCTPEQFPSVEYFRELKVKDSFNSSSYVAEAIIRLAFDPDARPSQVKFEIPAESNQP